MKRLPSIIAILSGFCLSAAEPATNSVQSAEKTAMLMGRRVSVSKDGADFSDAVGGESRKAREAKKQELPVAHSPEDIFLRMNGEVLTWAKIDEYIDLVLKISPLNLPPQATVEQINQIVATSRRKLAEMAGNQYIQSWILVPKAKEYGISLAESEILLAISNSVRKVAKKNVKEVLTASLDPNSYLYRKQVGYLYSKKYVESALAGKVVASNEEISAAIAERKAEIEKAKAYNETLRPKLQGILDDIKSGKIEFGDAAFEYSDCGSSTEDGVFGEFSVDKCKLLPPLKEFVFAASTNELSDVIETPFSYHIVKILSRSYGKEALDEDDDDDDGDDDETSAEVEK